MKKILLTLAILFSGLIYSQTPTGTYSSGKYKMYTPDLGTIHDSCVVWNGTDKKLKFIPISDVLAGFGGSQNLQETYENGGFAYPFGSVVSNDGLSTLEDSFEMGGGHFVRQFDNGSGSIGSVNWDYDTQEFQNFTSIRETDWGSSTGQFHVRQKDAVTLNQTDFGILDPLVSSDIKIPAPAVGGTYYTGLSVNGTPFDSTGDVTISTGGANLGYTASPTNGIVTSDSGTDATIPLADGTNAGLESPAQFTKLAGIAIGANVGVVPNSAITGATKTKITYDSKGLVTVGSDATTADISDSTNKRYQTDAQQTNNDATSSIQTQINGKQPQLSGTGFVKATGTTISYDNSTYLTTTSAGTTYFPLTGGSITGTGGSGFIGLIPQSSAPSTPTNGVRLYARSTGGFSWIGTNGFTRSFISTGVTADHTYTLPDADGTAMLTDNTQTVTNKNLNSGTNTFPTFNQNTTGSAATLTTARTIGIVTGDATVTGSIFDGSANNTNALTLATVNSNVGNFGSASKTVTTTINAKGLTTAIAEQNIAITESQVTNLTTDLSTLTTNVATNTSSITTNTANLIKKQLREGKIEYAGKTINFEMDSYGTGSIVTYPTTQKWSTLVAGGCAGTEATRAFSGTTVEKRSPVNWAGGSATNLIDDMVNIPAYSAATTSILVIALGTNDAGQTGSNYTTANFNTDYSTALTYINGTKGYPFERILLVSPYYVNSTGYASYATLTGNSAPTLARFETFVAETKTISDTFGTMYLDVFHDEQTNNTTSTAISTDGIHKTTYGHAFIAHDFLGYIGQTSLLFGVKTGSTVTNPTSINLGGTNSSANNPSSGKLILYDNGNGGIYSLGVSANLDLYTAAGQKTTFWNNTTRIADFTSTGLAVGLASNTAIVHIKAGTATASTAPLKFTSGTNLTTTEAGAVEYNGTHLFFTAVNAGTRYQLDQQVFAGSYSGTGTATTTFTVTIGATQANTTYKVNVTPTNALSAGVFYVTNKTTTTFDVTFLSALTGAVTFDYITSP